jgi:hypothetical protein
LLTSSATAPKAIRTPMARGKILRSDFVISRSFSGMADSTVSDGTGQR